MRKVSPLQSGEASSESPVDGSGNRSDQEFEARWHGPLVRDLRSFCSSPCRHARGVPELNQVTGLFVKIPLPARGR
jgi:hypothetical protein